MYNKLWTAISDVTLPQFILFEKNHTLKLRVEFTLKSDWKPFLTSGQDFQSTKGVGEPSHVHADETPRSQHGDRQRWCCVLIR